MTDPDPNAVAWVNVDVPDLGITVQAPDGWSQSSSPAFPLQLLAPMEDGYRTNVGLSHERYDPPEPDGFLRWLDRVVAEREKDYPGWAELHRGSMIIDGHPCNAVHYRWHPPAPLDRDVEQLLAMVVVEPGLLLEIDATALAGGEDPLLRPRQIISTIEFQP